MPEDITFVSGQKYTYHVTLTRQEMSVTSSVTDWEGGNPVEGEVGL